MNIEDLTTLYRSNLDLQQATKMSAYMRDQFSFLGISSPKRKPLFKEVHQSTKNLDIKDIKDLSLQLWNLKEREFQYTAMELLDKHKRKLEIDDFAIGEILVTTKSWWDTVDFLSTHFFYPILSKMTESNKIKHVKHLASHKDMWMNRVGIIFQLTAKNDTDEYLLESAILPHIHSKEFFHQKAIGWALRQYSKYNPTYVQNFIQKHTLKPLSVREAMKYLE